MKTETLFLGKVLHGGFQVTATSNLTIFLQVDYIGYLHQLVEKPRQYAHGIYKVKGLMH